VAPETEALLQQMVANGEIDALVPERVWQELSRGLMAARPGRMFEVLRGCGALARLAPELDRLWGVPQPPAHHPEIDCGSHLLLVLQAAADADAPLPVRWACLCHDLGKGSTPPADWPRHIAHEARGVKLARALGERWRVGTACRELAELATREHGNIHRSAGLDAAGTVRLLDRCDAWRRPARFGDLLLACECDARGRLGLADRPYPQRQRLQAALAAATTAPLQEVAAQAAAAGLAGPDVGARIRAARCAAVAVALAAADAGSPDNAPAA
jgi:tRNA nucleotidyltransferase (CCA-adding enzyme)